jgi:flagellar motor switch protein FliG
LAAVSSILKASDGHVAMQILDNVAAQDQSLAERLTPPPPPPPAPRPQLSFADLARLDDHSLTRVLTAADSTLVTLALMGAAPHFVDRVLRRLHSDDAAQLRHDLDNPGPTRLSDVEHARQLLADLAAETLSERSAHYPPIAA